MTINNKNISVIIVSFKSENVLDNCLKSIDKNINVIIVDNSNDLKFKKKIERNYKNVTCILSKYNNGMGAGNNLGIKFINTDYAFILNPDVVLKKNTIKEIMKAVKVIDSFSIMAPISDKKKYPNYDLFNDNDFSNKVPFKVKSVDGFALFLNLKKLKKIKNFYFFDENFFLYLENNDLCKRLLELKENIYIVPKAKITHLGGMAVNSVYKNEIEFSRNWHWMWSKFYYHKKHSGYFVALLKTIGSLFSSKVKFIYYLLIGKNFKKKIYYMRLLGLLNSMIGKKSYYRPNLDN